MGMAEWWAEERIWLHGSEESEESERMGPRIGASAQPCGRPIPDPFDSPDELDALETQILRLSAQIEFLGHRVLVLLAEFDRREGWRLGGFSSAAQWLSARAGLDPGAARERVRTARALEELPLLSAGLGLGRLTYSQARALTRIASPQNEERLLEMAEGQTTREVERMVRGWRMRTAEDEAAREEERQRARCLSIVPELDGTYRVHGRLTPEQGALLMKALEAAGDHLFQEETPGQPYPSKLPPSPAAAARRRADALVLLAERALSAGFAETSGTKAERYQVVLHVDEEGGLKGCHGHEAGGRPRSHLGEHGVRVSRETSRRLACDGAVVRMTRGAKGEVLDLGHRSRTVNPALRRALEARDQGCRFPGCGLGFTEAHHIVHWADGGATRLDNCVLLCRHHHRLLHEGRWQMESLPGGRMVFHDPRGGPHYDGRWEVRRKVPTPVPGVEDASWLGWERPPRKA